MKKPLFREESLNQQSQSAFGSVILTQSKGYNLAIALVLMVTIASLAFINFFEYEEFYQSKGILSTTEASTVKLESAVNGKIFFSVKEGTRIKRGELIGQLETYKQHAQISNNLNHTEAQNQIANNDLNTLTRNSDYLKQSRESIVERLKLLKRKLHMEDSTSVNAINVELEINQQQLNLNKLDNEITEYEILITTATQELTFKQSSGKVFSHVDGVVDKLFFRDGDPVEHDDVIARVIADNSQLQAKIKVPSKLMSKLNLGQNVGIKISDYPYQKFGIIQSEISDISIVENSTSNQEENNQLIVLLKLSKQQLTKDSINYPIKPDMSVEVSFSLGKVKVIKWLTQL